MIEPRKAQECVVDDTAAESERRCGGCGTFSSGCGMLYGGSGTLAKPSSIIRRVDKHEILFICEYSDFINRASIIKRNAVFACNLTITSDDISELGLVCVFRVSGSAAIARCGVCVSVFAKQSSELPTLSNVVK